MEKNFGILGAELFTACSQASQLELCLLFFKYFQQFPLEHFLLCHLKNTWLIFRLLKIVSYDLDVEILNCLFPMDSLWESQRDRKLSRKNTILTKEWSDPGSWKTSYHDVVVITKKRLKTNQKSMESIRTEILSRLRLSTTFGVIYVLVQFLSVNTCVMYILKIICFDLVMMISLLFTQIKVEN